LVGTTFIETGSADSASTGPPCIFQIGITMAMGTNLGIYHRADVLAYAQAEIKRIFDNAGIGVVFGTDVNPRASGSYTITLLPDVGFGTLGHGFQGEGVGVLYTGELRSMAFNNPFGYVPRGIGTAIGRITAHEAVTHNFLNLSNAEGHRDGLTHSPFSGSELFKFDGANNGHFEIPNWARNGLLDLYPHDEGTFPVRIGPHYY
jgi:hypothetical protein